MSKGLPNKRIEQTRGCAACSSSATRWVGRMERLRYMKVVKTLASVLVAALVGVSAVAAGFTAGCGQSLTGSPAASVSPQQPTLSASSIPATPDGGAEAIETYLEDVRPAFRAALKGHTIYMAVVESLYSSPSSDLVGMLARLRDGSAALAAKYAEAHEVVVAVQPAASLEDANESLSRYFSSTSKVGAKLAAIYADTALDADAASMQQAEAKLREIVSSEQAREVEALRKNWDAEVDNAATRAGVDLPRWLHEYRRIVAEPWQPPGGPQPM